MATNKSRSKSSDEDILINKAVWSLYLKKRMVGEHITAAQLQKEAKDIAKRIDNKTFKGDMTWLRTFLTQHKVELEGFGSVTMLHEIEEAEAARVALWQFIAIRDYTFDDLYNAATTEMYYKLTPHALFDDVPGFKTNVDKVGILCCTNRSGNHRLKLRVVGTEVPPLKISQEPIKYYHSTTPKFTQNETINWFHNEFVPCVYDYQKNVLKRSETEVRALLVWDTADAHVQNLISHCNRIRTTRIPMAYTKLIEPQHVGIIQAFKRIYRCHFAMYLTNYEIGNQTQQWKVDIAETFKTFTLHDALVIMIQAWNEVSKSTLVNAWSNLVDLQKNENEMLDIEDLTTEEIPEDFFEEYLGIETNEVNEWLNCDEKELKISESIQQPSPPKVPHSTKDAFHAVNTLMRYCQHNSKSLNGRKYQGLLRNLRDDIVKISKK